MLKNKNSRIDNRKLKSKAGFDANESRFGGDVHELRENKALRVPTLKSGVGIVVEQGWNLKAKNRDLVRITMFDKRKKIRVSTILEREDLEQMIAYLAQGDELIKYNGPKIHYDGFKNPNLKHTKVGTGLYNKPVT